ncbi:putative membrane protein [Streptomyces davaonensis JCM 4913]|uniref:Putative membrane protein n=1 Tax=Streptomyces davaonensis (strain DSM 101723 / JCM 4913 / KCC S-0913 / 768) TaxID=1214101 RepID=K4R1M2_STRDJ|nr:hypothetical protein [Streptomyces davaonensis]CCK26564.1 putative membrane protein [Streptomyces davaonensis JCM 4913]
MNYDVAGLVLAIAAAARSYAPDVWFLVRRLLGAGVRIGASALSDQPQPPVTTATPTPGGRR